MSNSENAFLNLITNEVEVDSNMFHSGVKNRIRTHLSCPDIITINDWASR